MSHSTVIIKILFINFIYYAPFLHRQVGIVDNNNTRKDVMTMKWYSLHTQFTLHTIAHHTVRYTLSFLGVLILSFAAS